MEPWSTNVPKLTNNMKYLRIWSPINNLDCNMHGNDDNNNNNNCPFSPSNLEGDLRNNWDVHKCKTIHCTTNCCNVYCFGEWSWFGTESRSPGGLAFCFEPLDNIGDEAIIILLRQQSGCPRLRAQLWRYRERMKGGVTPRICAILFPLLIFNHRAFIIYISI
jgi:hypothetical protein